MTGRAGATALGPAGAKQLLEDSWSARGRRLRGVELRTELVVSACFLAAAVACAAALEAAEAPAGVVSIARRWAPFGDEERELLDHLCEHASVPATHAERHAMLSHQTLTDELTGLANHRRLQELLTATVARFSRHDLPASLILLDIDDFKAINDRHGHLTGDRVLRALGRCLREVCRATAELPLVAPDGEPLALTASCGVAGLGPAAPDASALIQAADAALYGAKHEGKNCVRTEAVELPRVAAA